MPVYFLLHNSQLLPNTETFREGRRNCATFLFGTAAYAALYVLVKNMQLSRAYGRYLDAVLAALLALWLADCAVMAYTYRAHYGRNILCELADDDQRAWVYDDATHKYRRPSRAELQARAEDERLAAAALAEAREAAARGAAVLRRKREGRAARTIQTWWRARLYNPPHGILYLRALQDFHRVQNE